MSAKQQARRSTDVGIATVWAILSLGWSRFSPSDVPWTPGFESVRSQTHRAHAGTDFGDSVDRTDCDQTPSAHQAIASTSSQSSETQIHPSTLTVVDPWSAIDRDAVALVRLGPATPPKPDAPQADDAGSASLLTQITLLLSRQLGIVLEGNERLRLFSDITAGVVQLFRYPLTLAVLDVRVAPRPDGGNELSEIQMALLVDTGGPTNGRTHPVQQQIQHLLNTYTNKDHARLSTRDVQGRTLYELADDHLPGWARVAWVDMGASYIITFGDKAMQRVLDTLGQDPKALGADDWVREAQRACRCTGPEMTWYVNVDALRRAQRRDAGTGFLERVDAVLGFCHLSGASRMYGVISRDGRVVESSLFVRQLDQNRLIRIADHEYLKEWGYDIIPPEATVFSVVDARFSTLLPDLWEAYVASFGPAGSANLRQALADVEKESGVTARELFAGLSDRIIIHDFPRHALGLPIARTILVPLRGVAQAGAVETPGKGASSGADMPSGAPQDSAAFSARLDRFMGALSKRLQSGGAFWTLQHDPDGVWFVHFGLEGPALAVSGRWLVISYSPFAVRENVKRLRH